MKSSSLIKIGLACLVLGACGHSPQTRFYTVDTAAGASAPLATYAGPSLHLAGLRIPAIFDRPQVTRDTGGAEMAIDEFSHWGGPLDGLLRNALQNDLASTLPAGEFIPDVESRRPDTAEVSVDILSIRSQAGATAMDATWTLAGKDGHGTPVHQAHTAHLSVAGGGATPAAYSESLSALMAQLAAAIAQNAAGRG